jgi:hypothetical protein
MKLTQLRLFPRKRFRETCKQLQFFYGDTYPAGTVVEVIPPKRWLSEHPHNDHIRSLESIANDINWVCAIFPDGTYKLLKADDIARA